MGVWGRPPNQVFFLQNSHYKVRYKLYLTNCWSDKLLTTTIVIGTSKKLNVQTFKWFWAVLPGQKTTLCVFWNKYGHQIGNAMYMKCYEHPVIAPGMPMGFPVFCTLKIDISMIWNKIAMDKNKLHFDQGEMLKNSLILHTCCFLDMLIPVTQVLKLYIQTFLSYGLYVCIILETTHHRFTLGILCNIT